MKLVRRLKDTWENRDDDGNLLSQKGTTCDLLASGASRFVRKQWHTGDWVFSGDYEYAVEKHVYLIGNDLGLPMPKLFEFDDTNRSLLLEYVDGEYIDTPCDDYGILPEVLDFYDRYANIGIPEEVEPCTMEGGQIHNYRLEQLGWMFGPGDVYDTIDTIYEGFLQGVEHLMVPFDRILHNTMKTADGLQFYDFEWTITGPHEFTLARIAVEFRAYDHTLIRDRIGREDLYHLFLLRFYLYGREPETLGPCLEQCVRDDRLRLLLATINEHKYGDDGEKR